jgi:uncharacterized protein (TIGR03086 family)
VNDTTPNDTTPSDIAGWHRQAIAAVRPIVAGIGAADWERPTPCDGWSVRDLLNHVVAGNWWAARLAAGETIDDVGSDLDGDQVGDDALSSYDRSAAAAAAAFEAPGALDAPCAVSYGPVPGSVYAGHRTLDVLVHGVDLADATGQEAPVAPELVDACWAVVEPELPFLQASGAFGTPVDVGNDADPLTRLLGALGRRRS